LPRTEIADDAVNFRWPGSYQVVRRRDDGVLDMMVPPPAAEMVAIDRRDVQAGDPGRRKSLSVAGIG
jgi:hypothetical protein